MPTITPKGSGRESWPRDERPTSPPPPTARRAVAVPSQGGVSGREVVDRGRDRGPEQPGWDQDQMSWDQEQPGWDAAPGGRRPSPTGVEPAPGQWDPRPAGWDPDRTGWDAGPAGQGAVPAGQGAVLTGQGAVPDELTGRGAVPDDPRVARRAEPDDNAEDDQEFLEPVPVRRLLSLAIATFAGLLGVGLIFGAQTAGVGSARLPYAIVIFGVQALFVLAWTMATRPPGLLAVAVVGILAAAAADGAAVLPTVAAIAPLGYVAVAGLLASILGQLLRRADRARVTESLGSTMVLVVGVVAFATLIVLTRRPVGTQAIVVCLTATGLALLVARLTDAFLPLPRLADQVPRGALGVVLGAMAGTVAAAALGAYIRGFSPRSAALVGMVAAGAAVLADLGVGYAEASRELAGEPPNLWLARHMQGPLSGFALAAPLAYVMSVLFLVPPG